ncbi:MAG TPA: phenylalanine--tRNA ligase subunit beta [Tepidisphaeraceae bacterium]|nr:phenylalanine--tRNA ligase subunit beta [Tepidisphaeraceae bacterium]
MNTSLEWLSDFLPRGLDAKAAQDALTHGGLPVENVNLHGDDPVLDVEVTSNRADCLSHVGVARELSALLNLEFRGPDIAPVPPVGGGGGGAGGGAINDVTSVRIDAPHLCPHYTARVIRNVKVGPSPRWMVRRLEAVGLRSINNVVDVTNYVMFELGQPLHAFDFDRLTGRRIIVREARPGESITSIDGHERKLAPGMLVIADAERPVALAGVMGGADSEVSDRTVNVLLESARFDPLSVRRTARALAMKSDSSYRFERGIDPTLPERASRRAAQLIVDTAGGELLPGVAVAGAENFKPRTITMRFERLRKLLGVDVPAGEAVEALRRLQLSPREQEGAVAVTVPSWRQDLSIEVDVIEEVARVVGYDRIPVRQQIEIRLTPPEPQARTMELMRSTLVGAGYFEAVTFTFVSDALAGDFVPKEYAGLPRADAAVRKADARLRPSILPGLLEAVRRNESVGTAGAKLFETGSTFGVDAAGKVDERRKLALVGDDDLRGVRGAVEALLGKLDSTRPVTVVPDQRAGFAPGAAGRIEWGGAPVGYLGRIDKKVGDKLSLRTLPAAAELELPPLIAGTQHVPQQRALPRFPAVRRDLSLVVADDTAYERIDSLVASLKLPNLEAAEYVTTYRGKPLEKGTKSVTVTLVFRSPAATLTSEQVESSVQQVIEAARSQLGATLRT